MSGKISDKKIIKLLIDNSIAKGLKHVVISPGSRNAPLTISFATRKEFKCYAIVDERSAAFFALGLAQQLNEPVALICTSGTAVLNYAPAIAEAYYQRVPLIILTADRPFEWVDQEDGQTIDQNGIYENYIKYSATLTVDIYTKDDEWYVNRTISEAFYHCKNRSSGPVHLNIPLREPLYGKVDFINSTPKVVEHIFCDKNISALEAVQLGERLSEHNSVMIIAGMMRKNEALNRLLSSLSELENVIVLTETTSNLKHQNFINNIDRAIASIKQSEAPLYAPSLLITMNGPIISRSIKNYLRNHKPVEHWHIDADSHHLDPFQALTLSIETTPLNFLEAIFPNLKQKKSTYKELWQVKRESCIKLQNEFIKEIPWCDFRAFEQIYHHLPKNYTIQLGNSTPVRYGQLFDEATNFETYSNRGTSGIDGCVSTASGAAWITQQSTLLVVGDLSAMYDSNGLWHNYISPKLKIIVINNGGGGIFRFIEGPSTSETLDDYFEVSQQNDFSHWAAMHRIDFKRATSETELQDILPLFFNLPHCAILEITTPAKLNAQILRNYFEKFKN